MVKTLVVLTAFFALGCAWSTTRRLGLPPLQTVDRVALNRYTGTWYEIARYPQRFQRGCTATTTTYTRQDDGTIGVVNACRQGSQNGTERATRGLVRVTDPTSNAKLQVRFARGSWRDYWIIDLGPDYTYAVVGHPSRDALWILSRSPTLDEHVYAGILDRLERQNYAVERLRKTPQSHTPDDDPPSVRVSQTTG